MFHKHKFIKEGLNLYCECGKIKKLDCCHKWKVHYEDITTTGNGKHQVQQCLICENCGKIKFLNLTTQTTEDDNINVKFS